MIPSLPTTAWEQAVFVALFVVFCLSLIGGLLSWFTRQQRQWQDYIAGRDKDWQGWMDKAEMRAEKQMDAVMGILDGIARKIDQHDDKVEQRIKAAQESATQPRRTQPRKKQEGQ